MGLGLEVGVPGGPGLQRLGRESVQVSRVWKESPTLPCSGQISSPFADPVGVGGALSASRS